MQSSTLSKKFATENTPLVQPRVEDIHPLPWFRSPEDTSTRKRTYDRFKAQKTWGDYLFGIFFCCFPSRDDLEHGNTMENEASFRKCIQFLIGVTLLIAIGLLVMIFFNPFEDIQ
jgi:hypothetical protein